MFKGVADKWFNDRTQQMNLRVMPKLPVFARSNNVRPAKETSRKPGAPKPFIVGESVVGGEEVAM